MSRIFKDEYNKVGTHLLIANETEITMTISEIESIIGKKLPASAHEHRVWWANHENNPQCFWMRAGYKIESLSSSDLKKKIIVFHKI